jgi:hypothetical protein
MHGTCVAVGHRCLQELSNLWRGAVNSSVDTLDKVYWITQLRNSVALVRLSHLFAKFSFCVHIISDLFFAEADCLAIYLGVHAALATFDYERPSHGDSSPGLSK